MSKLFYFALLLLFTISVAVQDIEELRGQFEGLVEKYGRNYVGEEKENRFQIFLQNAKRLEISKKLDPRATHDFNKFFDVSKEEFQKYKNKKMPADQLARSCLTSGVTAPHYDTSNLPDSFDWRTKNVVTPVKDQGMCGSCWAFSTVATVESAWAIKTGKLLSLSEQEVVDCSKGCTNEPPWGKVCNSGCGGGWPWIAYFDLINLGGLESETDYSYRGVDEVCKYNKSKVVSSLYNYTCLTDPNSTVGADEDVMAAALIQNGPLSVALNAEWLQDYYGGVTWPLSYFCDSTTLDHAVTIVGYGSETGWFDETVNYWIVKNSWGTDWGESGYFRIGRGGGVCGINNAVVYPNL
jgi:cathepsin F